MLLLLASSTNAATYGAAGLSAILLVIFGTLGYMFRSAMVQLQAATKNNAAAAATIATLQAVMAIQQRDIDRLNNAVFAPSWQQRPMQTHTSPATGP